VAKQRRRRRRGPAELPGQRKAKYPFPVNLIFNVKAFYLFFIVVMIASMAAVGFGASSSSSTPPDIVDIDTTPEATSDVSQWPDGPPPVIDTDQPHVATLVTDQGNIEIELSTEAPLAVNSLAFLAAKNFYDGAAFFYADKEYFAQAGDPTCNTSSDRICSGLGGPGYSLSYEDSGLKHEQWSVVLPTTTDGSTDMHGSQFRILFTADPRLDGKETVFGAVVGGQDILQSLANFSVCSISTSSDCQDDLSNALIIRDLTVEPA
jgi:cyclophilin family peptidyl-prolyl cis-trans isomerase